MDFIAGLKSRPAHVVVPRLADAVADDPHAATAIGLVSRFAPAIVEKSVLPSFFREEYVRVLARYRAVDLVIFCESQIVAPGRAVHAIHVHGATDIGPGLCHADLGLVGRALQHDQPRRLARWYSLGALFLDGRFHPQPFLAPLRKFGSAMNLHLAIFRETVTGSRQTALDLFGEVL